MSTKQVRARPLPPRRLPDEPWTASAPGRAAVAWLPIAAVCVAIVVAALASALVVAVRQPKVYGARADLLYLSSADTPLDARERTIATQRDLISSRAVLAPVAAQTGMSLEDLRKAVSVQVGVRNDLMHVTVGDRSPARAERVARAVTTRYLGLSRRLATAADAEGPSLERQITQLTARAARARPAERDVLVERVARLQDRALEVDAATGGASKPTLLAPAYLLDQPLSPKPLRAAALGLIVGLLLAAVAAVALVRTSARRPAP